MEVFKRGLTVLCILILFELSLLSQQDYISFKHYLFQYKRLQDKICYVSPIQTHMYTNRIYTLKVKIRNTLTPSHTPSLQALAFGTSLLLQIFQNTPLNSKSSCFLFHLCDDVRERLAKKVPL